MRSFNIERAAEIRDLVGEAQVVGVDEAQFLDPELVDVCEELANDGRRVIVAGLDMDYLGRPFEPIPHLLAVAEYITKQLAICVVCGNPADVRSSRWRIGARWRDRSLRSPVPSSLGPPQLRPRATDALDGRKPGRGFDPYGRRMMHWVGPSVPSI